MWLVIVGNVVEGFTFIGPFQEHDGPGGAFAMGESLFGDASEPAWCTAEIQSLEEARAEAAWAAGKR
ncbi:MAG: hypothetical protein JO051_13150 [Acidobacteriaceae bacterium]|nr:hypothetical protein [Acidobacteriaceae bacterium]